MTDGSATPLQDRGGEEAGGQPVCWICRSSEPSESGMPVDANHLSHEFCVCRGSLGVAHESCILDYVKISGNQSCPTCATMYRFYAVVPPGMPPRPTTLPGKALLIARRFVIPITVKATWVTFVAAVRYIFLPLLIGMFYAACLERWEWPWYHAWIVGMTLCLFRRGAADMWRRFSNYFRNIAEEDVERPPAPSSAHDAMWWIVDCGKEMFANVEATSVAHDLAFGLAVTFIIAKFPLFVVCGAAFGAACVLHIVRPVKTVRDKRTRRQEALAYKPHATPRDIQVWFLGFCCDVLLFSAVMPYLAGLIFHFTASLVFPSAGFNFSDWPTPLVCALHWFMGFLIVSLMIVIESDVMIALFAPGVDLIVLRSVTLDSEHDTAEFTYVHRFEVDPFRSCMDAIKMYACELPALALTTFAPLAVGAALRRLDFSLLFDSLLQTEETRSMTLADLLWPINATLGIPDPDVSSSWLWQLHQLIPVAELPLLPEGLLTFNSCLHVVCFFAAVRCFFEFEVRRPLLAFMLPLAKSLGAILGLRAYLFDPERLVVLQDWLYNTQAPIFAVNEVADLDDLMPPIPFELKVTRRERWLSPKDIPPFLPCRLMIFAFFFFGLSFTAFTLGFGALVCLWANLTPLVSSLAMFVALPVLTFFFMWSPSLTLTSGAHVLLFAIVPIALIFVWPVLSFMSLRWSGFTDDLYNSYYKATKRLLRQTDVSTSMSSAHPD